MAACSASPDYLTESDLYAQRTMNSERAEFRANLITNSIEAPLSGELNDSTESGWRGAFWAMGLIRYTSPITENAARMALNGFDQLTLAMQSALLEMVYTSYPDLFSDPIYKIIYSTESPKIFAMCAHYLFRINPEIKGEISRIISDKFREWQTDPVLIMLQYYLVKSILLKHYLLLFLCLLLLLLIQYFLFLLFFLDKEFEFLNQV